MFILKVGLIIIIVGAATVYGICQLAKHDALMKYHTIGAIDADIAEIRPSLSHVMWIRIRFNTGCLANGMHWYVFPWRDTEVIK